MAVINFFLFLLLARMNSAYPFSTSPQLDASERVGSDQTLITKSDDSDSNIVFDQNDPNILSDGESQPSSYAVDELVTDAEPPSKTSALFLSDSSCTSATSNGLFDINDERNVFIDPAESPLKPRILAMTDEVDTHLQSAGGMCPQASTPSPGTPPSGSNQPGKFPQEGSHPNGVNLVEPDCTHIPGNKRVAFCCKTAGPHRGRTVRSPVAYTKRRNCELWSKDRPICWSAVNIFCGLCRTDTYERLLFDAISPFFPDDGTHDPTAEPLNAPVPYPPLRQIEIEEASGPGREVWAQLMQEKRFGSGPQYQPGICSSEYLKSQGYVAKRNRNTPYYRVP